MVLATIISKYKVILVLSVLLVSCSKESKEKKSEIKPVITDTTSVNGIVLELIDNKGKGELKINSEKYKTSGNIKVGPPCYFLKHNGRILSYSYPDIGIDHTLLVQGRSGIQGVLFKKDSIIYNDYLPTMNSYDVKVGADEIMYYDFAHRRHKRK